MIFSVSVIVGIIRYNAGMVESWFLLDSPAAHAAANMALDEALLQTAGERGRAVLRVYGWTRPAVSFGYSQKFPAEFAGRFEIVRRPTGGGIVYHGDDTTYTVVTPAAHRLCAMSAREAYCVLHRAVAAALKASLQLCAGAASPRGQYECFANPVPGDVMAGARKLAGGAQRRTRCGLLHQGSIAVKLPVERIAEAFRQTMNIGFEPYRLTEAERELAEHLAREKYATDQWNRRRS
jgi:lipoate-protein ligase A